MPFVENDDKVKQVATAVAGHARVRT
jgi:hypothetical protein